MRKSGSFALRGAAIHNRGHRARTGVFVPAMVVVYRGESVRRTSMKRRKKDAREKDLTARYLGGDVDEDRLDSRQRFSARSGRAAERRRIEETALMRAAAESAQGVPVESLPIGSVVQVYSLYYEVEAADGMRLCVLRKTLSKLLDTPVVVGDRVRFRDIPERDERGRQEAVIEQLLPRATVLSRADSFRGMEQHPIVANADSMLIVVSLREPQPRWGLVDRMLVAARSGGLRPVVCINKIDLIDPHVVDDDVAFAEEVASYYQGMGIDVLRTSVMAREGIEALRGVLRHRTTVLAGHSGVGKSSLIHAVQPTLDVRIGAISGHTGKGRHTTTSARRYVLDLPAQVIDTPGVKLFGLWNVTADNLPDYFPDVADGSAPEWRNESYRRILASLEGDAFASESL